MPDVFEFGLSLMVGKCAMVRSSIPEFVGDTSDTESPIIANCCAESQSAGLLTLTGSHGAGRLALPDFDPERY